MGRDIALCAAAFFLMLSSGCNRPAEPVATNVPAAAASSIAPAAASSIAVATPAVSDEALAWMEGRWCGKDEDQQVEETWLTPYKDEAIGMSRTIGGGRMLSFEFMRIANLDGTLTLLAQPGGAAAVPFKRTDGDKDWIRFENPQHDYPQRIEYRRVGEELHAEVGGPGANGAEEVIPYVYTRCK